MSENISVDRLFFWFSQKWYDSMSYANDSLTPSSKCRNKWQAKIAEELCGQTQWTGYEF